MVLIAEVTPPSTGIFRLVRAPADPFSPTDWDRSAPDGTFGNRFDDPSAEDGRPVKERFRVIYCATQRTATFGETIARFRVSLALLNALQNIDDDEPIAESLRGVVDPDDPRHGLLPADWRMRRRIGHTMLEPSLRFADLNHPETMQSLRTALSALADRLGLNDVDLSSVTSPQRRFTQGIARYIYEQVDEMGRPRFAGIRYPSRLNPEWECWAIFDGRIRHLPGWPNIPTSFFPDDADLQEVARLFGLTIEIFPGQDLFIRPWRV